MEVCTNSLFECFLCDGTILGTPTTIQLPSTVFFSNLWYFTWKWVKTVFQRWILLPTFGSVYYGITLGHMYVELLLKIYLLFLYILPKTKTTRRWQILHKMLFLVFNYLKSDNSSEREGKSTKKRAKKIALCGKIRSELYNHTSDCLSHILMNIASFYCYFCCCCLKNHFINIYDAKK